MEDVQNDQIVGMACYTMGLGHRRYIVALPKPVWYSVHVQCSQVYIGVKVHFESLTPPYITSLLKE